MEASALRHAARVPALTGLSPHLRLQSDERLVALVRRGHQGAFEALLKRYQPRLLAFCRHMLGSNEDAEDVLQEVFTAAYNAICADDRPISARPWLYRIARNRCLNHLRRPSDAGQDSMDVFEREAGATAADTVHRREEFRQVVADVHDLPESQRTALLLREIDTLSYDQIADAMETTVPSVKSLLVRARLSLAEASEARHLTCAEVRLQLSQSAEGLAKPSAASRRHVRSCQRCRIFKRELRKTSHALAAVSPVGAAAALKLLGGGSAGTAAGKGAASSTTVAGGAALAGGGAGALSAVSGSVVVKAAAGLAAAAVVTVGAVEVREHGRGGEDTSAATPPAPVKPVDDRERPPPAAKTLQPVHRRAAPGAAAAPVDARQGDQREGGEAGTASERPSDEDAGAAVSGSPTSGVEGASEEPAASSGAAAPEENSVSSQGGASATGEEGGGFPAVTDPAAEPSSPSASGEEQSSSGSDAPLSSPNDGLSDAASAVSPGS